MTDCQPLRRRLDEEEAGGSCCANCGVGAAAESIRIATWANVAPTIQAYVDFYSKVNPEASPIRLSVFPSLKELQLEALLDVTVGSKLYDGFAIPPMLMADLLEQRGLASLDSIATSREWKDLLPYYRSHVATFDGSIRAMPLFSGNQMLLLFRKDYLDSKNLKTPKTWGEFLRIAASLHNEPLGNDGEKIYGACIGRLSEQACRQKRDQTGQPCNSLSMTYLGVQLSSMTQMKGSSTGWLFDNDASNGMNPLLKPTLEYSLVITEEMMKYGAPKELDADSSLNLELFREGRCAMTLSADHPADLLQGLNVGFAPLPGAFKVLDRETDTLVQCDSELCPYATNYEELGHVNMVPFGAHDMVIGGVSALVPETKQAGVKEFMQFVMNTRLNISLREQPMTYSGISSSNILGYEKLIEGLTSNKNGAIPFRAPTAFQLLSDADTQVYEYLKARNYSHSNRVHLTESIEKTWERTIQRHDDQVLAVPTSIFYEKSLGSFTPEASSDVYIGTPLRLTGWALGGISCLTSIIMALWVWRNREERVVRASQPIFLWMLCAGTLIMGSCIFPFGIEDDLVSFRGVDIACMASIWLYSIGFVMTYSALFSKMWRINRVFRDARNLLRIKLESRDIIFHFLLLFGSNFIVLLVWNITDPVQWVRVAVDDPGTELNLVEASTYGQCTSEHYRTYLGIILVLNTFVSVIMLIQAYECRKISTDYSESLWISGAMLGIVQIWIIGLPILKILGDNPKGIFAGEVVVVFVSCMSTLLQLFVPKIIALREERENEGELNRRASPAERRESVTEHEHSQVSEDTYGNRIGPENENNIPTIRMGNVKATGLEPPATSDKPTKRARRKLLHAKSGIEGIRLIQSSSMQSEEVERLQKNLDAAEGRNKFLQDRLERLQDKMEQYIVGHHPHGPRASSFIIQARVSGTN